MKSALKKLLTAILVGICALKIPAAVSADSLSDIGLQEDRTCTIQVTLADADTYNQAEPVYLDGAQLSLVKVASLNADGSYTLLDAFSGLAGWDDYINASDSSDMTKTAQDALAKASAGGVQAVDVQTTDENGKASLTTNAGDYGIYLLYESGRSENSTADKYLDIAPLLFQMPQFQDGQWIFDQTAVNPKVAKGITVTVRKRGGDADGNATDTVVLGAHLRIVSADDPDQAIDEWDTTEVDHDSVALEPGQYILQETSAPDGYDTAEPISFEVQSDGKLLIGGEEQDSNEIIMIDPLTTGGEKNETDVNTGDSSNIGLWIVLTVAAACAIVVIIIRKRKAQ